MPTMNIRVNVSWNGAVGWATGFKIKRDFTRASTFYTFINTYAHPMTYLATCVKILTHTHLMLIIPHNTKVNYLNLLTCSDHHSPAEPEQDFCWGIRLCYHCLAHPRFSWGSQVAKSNTSYIRDQHSWCIFFLNIVSDIRIKM